MGHRFANNLLELRKSHHLTQSQLGKLVGVDQRTISDWEKGVSEPGLLLIDKLCEIFNEDYNGLLG